MNKTRDWILIVGVLIILGVASFFVVSVVRNTAETALSPINDITGLGTQVAEFLNPTPTVLPDPVTIIHDVRSLARLETIQYSLEKIITAESGQGPFGFLFGDRLLFVAHGYVIAGVDMNKFTPAHLSVKNEVLYVQLPDAEVFVATLDNEKSYVYDRDTGLFTHGDVNLETTARQAAEELIMEAALEDGMLRQAQVNAENFFWRLFANLGYPEVIFITPTPSP
jgi:hypothetical protein